MRYSVVLPRWSRPTFQRCVLIPSPWWWRQYAPLKRRYTPNETTRRYIPYPPPWEPEISHSIVDSWELRTWSSYQWHGVRTKFHEYPLTGETRSGIWWIAQYYAIKQMVLQGIILVHLRTNVWEGQWKNMACHLSTEGANYLWFTWNRTSRTAQSVKILTADWGKGNKASPVRTMLFLLTNVFRASMGPTQPPVQWAPWAKTDHSHSSSGKVNKVRSIWIFTSISTYVLKAWRLTIGINFLF
jgi:hypothetical protein